MEGLIKKYELVMMFVGGGFLCGLVKLIVVNDISKHPVLEW